MKSAIRPGDSIVGQGARDTSCLGDVMVNEKEFLFFELLSNQQACIMTIIHISTALLDQGSRRKRLSSILERSWLQDLSVGGFSAMSRLSFLV